MRTRRIVDTLKDELRRQGLTYAALAKRLELSEAAVKRMFALGNFSLTKLGMICEVLGMDEKDLFRRLVREEDEVLPSLTEEQETGLAQDEDMLLVFYFLLLGKSRKEVRDDLDLDDRRMFSILRTMDRLGLIELHSGERIRFKIPRAPRWDVNGPLAKKYGMTLMEEFLSSGFGDRLEMQDFHTGTLSEDSFRLLERRLTELFKEFDGMADLDRSLDPRRLTTYWFYAGVRPWNPIGVIRRAQKKQKENGSKG